MLLRPITAPNCVVQALLIDVYIADWLDITTGVASSPAITIAEVDIVLPDLNSTVASTS
jgi:hypothetical protein